MLKPRVLRDDKLKSRIKCAINNRNIESRGVISDWDGDIVELGEAIDKKNNILKIERVKRRRYNYSEKSVSYIDTSNFIVSFKGRSLPESIELYNGLVKIRIGVYVPAVRQCYNCYRYGHSKAHCRSKNKVCVICGDHYHGQCDHAMRCTNCEGSHKSNDKICPKYDYNKKLLRISAEKHISIYEAKNYIKQGERDGTMYSNA